MLSNSFIWGPQPVSGGIARTEELLARHPSRRTERPHLGALAALRAYAADRDGADAALERLADVSAEMGVPAPVNAFRVAHVRRFLGDFEASLEAAMQSADWLASVGETGQRSTVLCFAAQACIELGLDDQALEAAEQGRALGADDDVVTQVLWRAVEAVVLGRRGDHAAAEARSREALERSVGSDGTAVADAWLARAECLSLAGRFAEAEEAARAGHAYWSAKQCVNGMRWAERWMQPAATEA
jgi:hypothetical protein